MSSFQLFRRGRRDLVAMTSTVDSSLISHYVEVYTNLLKVLASQVMTMEKDFFEVSRLLARKVALGCSVHMLNANVRGFTSAGY